MFLFLSVNMNAAAFMSSVIVIVIANRAPLPLLASCVALSLGLTTALCVWSMLV